MWVLVDKLKIMKKYLFGFILGIAIAVSGNAFAQEININIDTVKKLLGIIQPIYDENTQLKLQVSFLEAELEKRKANVCEIAVGQPVEPTTPKVNPLLEQKKARLNELLNQESALRAESKQIEDFIRNMFATEGYNSGTRDTAQQKNLRQIEITNILPKVVSEINRLQAEIAAM